MNNNTPKISIIIPIYNCDKYLAECLNSILYQDYKNIEILLINDGSKDKSLQICKKYQKNDLRVKLFNQENKGVSAARNLGLRHATGKYVSFIDADDWLDAGLYTHAVEIMEKNNIDVSYIPQINNKNIFPENTILKKKDIRSNFILPFIGNAEGKGSIIASVWSLIISRYIIQNLEFEAITMAEDKIFFIEVILRTNNMVYLKPYYHYRDNPTSTLKTYNPRYITDLTYCHRKIEKILKKYNMYTCKVSDLHTNTIIRNLYEVIKNESRANNTKSEKIKMVKKYYSSNNLSDIFTWRKTWIFAKRNPRWLLIKMNLYKYLIKQK